MPAKAARATKPDTDIGLAFDKAGYKTAAERLDDAIMAAAEAYPRYRQQAIQAFMDAVQPQTDLHWEVMGDHRRLLFAQRFDATMGALREIEEERQRAEPAKPPNGAGNGGQSNRVNQDAPAPAAGATRAQPFGSYSASLLERQHERERQLARVKGAATFEREALWDRYTIHGQKLKECSLGLVRSTSRIRGVEHRWFKLLGRQQAFDSMRIEEVWSAEQVEELYAQAKREHAADEDLAA
jgi:hypothetical protein